MKVFNSLKAGIIRSYKYWKAAVIVWLVSLLLVSVVAIPMKAALLGGLGKSTITENLRDGINIGVFADLGANFGSLSSYFSSGLFMALLVGYVINVFFAGGLFNGVKGSSANTSLGDFFRVSAKHFWSFLYISLIISFITLLLVILIVIIPVAVVSQSEGSSDVVVFRTFILLSSFFLFVLILILLVADYARAWQVLHDRNACFKAIGFGFSHTFRTFFSSYPLMLIIVIIHALYGWLIFNILSGFKPVTWFGIILLFIISQLFFFIKVLLRTWRYGSVTRMMEINSLPG
jgi:hypothetical protein